MAPQQVADSVKKKNWDVVDTPGAIGPDSGPALLPLLDDADPQVRELAVHSLDAAGGRAARQGLLKALDDKSDTVRSAACRFLAKHAQVEDLPDLQRQFTTHYDEYVREQVALIAGRLDQSSAVQALRAQLGREDDQHAKKALTLALARLGEAAAREDVLGRLRQDDPEERARALADLIYVNDPKLLRAALPLLDDTRPGKNVGPSHGPYFIRVCDVAVNTIDVMLNHPFRFAVQVTKRYEPAELAEAKAVVSRLQ